MKRSIQVAHINLMHSEKSERAPANRLRPAGIKHSYVGMSKKSLDNIQLDVTVADGLIYSVLGCYYIRGTPMPREFVINYPQGIADTDVWINECTARVQAFRKAHDLKSKLGVN